MGNATSQDHPVKVNNRMYEGRPVKVNNRMCEGRTVKVNNRMYEGHTVKVNNRVCEGRARASSTRKLVQPSSCDGSTGSGTSSSESANSGLLKVNNRVLERSASVRQKPRRPSCDDTSTISSVSSEAMATLVLRKDAPVPAECPLDLKTVSDFIGFMNEHNLEEMKKLTSDKCDFWFIDSECEMPAREFYVTQHDLNQSFPDLHYHWKSMSIKGVNGPASKHPGTVVVVKRFFGVGAHTGKPYGFGPYPLVETTGKKCWDSNMDCTFVVQDGKICHVMVDAFGEVVGPPGFYTQIGGMIF